MVYGMLCDHFGDEADALAFMRAFAGAIIRIPSTGAIERVARERQIVRTLQRDPDTAVVRRLSGVHGTTMRGVAKTFAKATGKGLKSLRARRAERALPPVP